MQSSTVYYKNGRIYPYLKDEDRYKEPPDKYIFFTYDEYKRRIDFLKNIASIKLSYSIENPNFKFTISDLKTETNAIVNIGLCNVFGIENRKNMNQQFYGQFNSATFKCPMMRKHIQEMNQEELESFIEFQNIKKCCDHRMCMIYNVLPNSDNFSNRIDSSIDSQHKFVTEILNDLKNYTIKT